ncbi:MAG: acylphosphatase [Chlorobium sp.]|uniref:acylphosphatase n=1 Tax=Chlorobium sp. TaxID=1095 RepID=UPI0025BDF99D|nr:acylphosphatase [Chlorobium sp.]MCF8216356.1 acylphosphatase [Chlorobium sp.]
MTKRVRLHVSGLVQGVGFRKLIERVACGHSLDGWVRNQPDGRVEIEAQVPAKDVEELLKKAGCGSSMSQVTEIKITDLLPDEKQKGLTIRF